MTAATPNVSQAPEHYLAFERASEIKHEYWYGETFAMTGASRRHNLLVANIVRLLGNALLDRHCEIYPSDMRVASASRDVFTYPDVTVMCEHPRFLDDVHDTLVNPSVLIEVLSPSIEAYDRG
ncbi:MAG: Uma2 family endonuclease, partial [Myxococcota bacterium]